MNRMNAMRTKKVGTHKQAHMHKDEQNECNEDKKVGTHKQAHMHKDEQNECNEDKKVAKEDRICNQLLWYCF